jgi:hypothetical protein
MGSQFDPLLLSRVGSVERLPSPNFPQLHFGEPSSGFAPGLGSASAKEGAPTPCPSDVFTFGFAIEFIQEFGVRQQTCTKPHDSPHLFLISLITFLQ